MSLIVSAGRKEPTSVEGQQHLALVRPSPRRSRGSSSDASSVTRLRPAGNAGDLAVRRYRLKRKGAPSPLDGDITVGHPNIDDAANDGAASILRVVNLIRREITGEAAPQWCWDSDSEMRTIMDDVDVSSSDAEPGGGPEMRDTGVAVRGDLNGGGKVGSQRPMRGPHPSNKYMFNVVLLYDGAQSRSSETGKRCDVSKRGVCPAPEPEAPCQARPRSV